MATATLTKWGNSVGVLIPKNLRNDLNLNAGDKVEISKNKKGEITIKPIEANSEPTISQIFEGWTGQYSAPSDFDTTGNEINWGGVQGQEMW